MLSISILYVREVLYCFNWWPISVVFKRSSNSVEFLSEVCSLGVHQDRSAAGQKGIVLTAGVWRKPTFFG